MAFAGEEPANAESKKDKRGVYGLGYGGYSGYSGYPGYAGYAGYAGYGGYHGLENGLGLATYSQVPAVSINHGVSAVLTKEVPVPVAHPVAVPVEKHVPVAVRVNNFRFSLTQQILDLNRHVERSISTGQPNLQVHSLT